MDIDGGNPAHGRSEAGAEARAERQRHYQRRYRAHNRGDHSLCSPDRHCQDVQAAQQAAAPPPASAPEPRGPRGQRLWDELQAGLGPAHRVLLDEACRLADRLDRIDATLRSREWFQLALADLGGTVARVTIDAALGEARQHATALRGLITEIRNAAPRTNAPVQPAEPPQPEPDRSARRRQTPDSTPGVVRDIAAELEARRSRELPT